jgi:hypothetical protein
MMLLLGPLILWWDGGGKGERFIQMVKPHIKQGVRVDSLKFFVTLLEKIFKVRQLELLEARHCLDTTNVKVSEDAVQLVQSVQSLAEVMAEIVH